MIFFNKTFPKTDKVTISLLSRPTLPSLSYSLSSMNMVNYTYNSLG